MSDYKIIIVLSRHNISFEYILNGQTVPSHMPKGKWPAPLAFYASSKGMVVGAEAARAAKSGTNNAFDNYFDLLPTPTTYTFGGKTQPIRKIFLEGAETVFEDFFQSVLFGRNGQLFENRDKMPLYIVCEADVKDEERIHIQTLFTEAGYKHVEASYMNDSLAELAHNTYYSTYGARFMMAVWADGFDLSLALFDAQLGKTIARKLVPNLGRDPRISRLYSDLWAQISSCNPWLDAEREKAQLMDVAIDFMNSSKHNENRSVVLSDGMSYHVLLQRPPLFDSDESKLLRREIVDILSANGASRANTVLALRGIAATNKFFYGNVGDGWQVVNRTNIDLRNDALRLLLSQQNSEIVADQSLPSGSRESRGEAEAEQPSATPEQPQSREARGEAEAAQPSATPEQPQSPASQQLKDWQRKKKVLLAQTDGKARVKMYAEAISLCQDFLPTIPADAAFDPIRTEINSKIAVYQQNISAQQKPKPVKTPKTPAKPAAPAPQPAQRPVRIITGGISRQTKEPTPTTPRPTPAKPQPPKPQPPTGDGYRLIKEGKLRDARDWFKARNQSEVVAKLSKLIRDQVSIHQYLTKELPKLKAKFDKARVATILNDVVSYLAAAKELGFIDHDATSLLKELQKLK
ncbi:MAG: hypothetical protein ACI4AM_00635 [Muribaculaceae bacterium]